MKKKIKTNHILAVSALALMLMCIMSVWQPVRFENEQRQREEVVKKRLMLIRTAEEKHKQRHGVYTGDFATLVKEKLLADSLQYIPFSNGKKFSLAATTIVGKSGKQTPLMECGATYETYLEGLDGDAIRQATNKANYAGLYPGLKIGDITTDNDNAGNW